MIIDGKINLSNVQYKILQQDYEALEQELVNIDDAKKLIESLNKDEKNNALQKCRSAYWEENYITIIEAIVSDLSVAISSDLREEARTIIAEMMAQTEGLKSKAELQSDLFKKYDVSYERYLGGTTA